MPLTRKTLPEFKEKLVEIALQRYALQANLAEESAGHSGAMHDNGASRMREEILIYRAGLEKQIPEFLQELYVSVAKEQDTEYSEYLRLKNKFEGERSGCDI